MKHDPLYDPRESRSGINDAPIYADASPSLFSRGVASLGRFIRNITIRQEQDPLYDPKEVRLTTAALIIHSISHRRQVSPRQFHRRVLPALLSL